MGSSYQSSNFNSQANVTNVTNILTQNQNVVGATVISDQQQFITIGTINCPQGVAFTQSTNINVTITGQMTSQVANDISNYIATSISASLDQSAKVTTELLGIYGSGVQKAQIVQQVNQFCAQYITTTNLQTVMANVRVSQIQQITIGNLSGALCTFSQNIVVAIAATGVLDSISNQMITNSLTAQMAAAVSQYYTADAKGLNSLVSAALTALLLPLIIGAGAIALIIILVVVFKVLNSKSKNATIDQAKQLGLDPNKADPVKDNAAIQKAIDDQQQKINLSTAQSTIKPTTPTAAVKPVTTPVRPGVKPTVPPRPVTRPPPPVPPKPASLKA